MRYLYMLIVTAFGGVLCPFVHGDEDNTLKQVISCVIQEKIEEQKRIVRGNEYHLNAPYPIETGNWYKFLQARVARETIFDFIFDGGHPFPDCPKSIFYHSKIGAIRNEVDKLFNEEYQENYYNAQQRLINCYRKQLYTMQNSVQKFFQENETDFSLQDISPNFFRCMGGYDYNLDKSGIMFDEDADMYMNRDRLIKKVYNRVNTSWFR